MSYYPEGSVIKTDVWQPCLYRHRLQIRRFAELDCVHVAELAEERLVEELLREFLVVDEVQFGGVLYQ